MTPIEVSIIVPVYNCETYLAELLDSLRRQAGVSFEIIAVNDGSTDSSPEMLADTAHNDSRLVIINQANQGLSAARNAGIARAKGQWIAFVDGDDWLAPNALLTWLRQAEQQQLDLLVGNGFSFTTDPCLPPDSPLLHKQLWGQTISGQQWIIRSVEHNEWPHYVWLQLIRRELINTHQLVFIPKMLHEDILWTTHLALVARRIGFCETPFYGYRTNPQSITHSPSTQALLARANSYLHIIKALVSLARAQELPLRAALLRHANQESGHFLGLMRKRLPPSPERTALAIEFRELGLPSALYRGASNIHEFWRALRCSVILARLAQQNHNP
ncbi:glycosyltransferase [Yersinia enterocolitica]|uniref:glycosyltransferase n=1 Tax=Yersinia enterocolitica TaxID=630 RepID=UPI001CA56BA7|nr:glycosyltransferase [Yersinia enterocolitica]MBW5834911.1 glycosyltransferase [Yersinia enterocolitica]MBX9476556.1 glycosyltransferase [Yersinia enterocolitica]MBX9486531.1 glycosyltransferase [Yersinia enterocolitica]MBX9491086.1 glycosyltransferase [Yersinia enterocolitica]HEN3611416.1 glycosyltransferase [Yersinia enterocolitica]